MVRTMLMLDHENYQYGYKQYFERKSGQLLAE